MSISTHILDTNRGRPLAGIAVELDRACNGVWTTLNALTTDAGGRISALLPEGTTLDAGTYSLRFATASYYERQGIAGLYPTIEITFTVREGETHFHIPLLLTANGYTTYRGS